MLLLLVSGIVTLGLTLLPPLHYLESQLYDLRLYFQSPQRPHPELVLVHLTPGEGRQLLKTLERLPSQGVRAIGLDTPRLFEQGQGPAFRRLTAIKGIPLILSTGLERESSGRIKQIKLHSLVQDPARLPANALHAAVAQGFSFYPPDLDGTVRAQPLILQYRPQSQTVRQLPSFAYALYRTLYPQAPASPIDRYLAYPGTRTTYPTLSLKELQRQPTENWRGKILLISDQIAPLRGRTPFQASISQLELHAYALAGLFEQRSLVRPKFLNALLPVLLPVLALGVLWLTLRWGLMGASFGVLILLFGYFTFNVLVFQSLALWLDLVVPSLSTLAGTAAVMFHFHRTEGQTRRELLSTFRRHLPDQVARALMEQQGDSRLQNERRIVTVMFTDIQGFSRMGEKLPPDQIIHILNEYFAAMTEIIFANQGSLDKYIGDGIMAVYGNIGSNNPRQDAHYAVKTALEMQDKMAELQKKWMNEGIRPIQIRIGINTGEALVGHVGHPRRKEMTVIGDTVNTAARIEKLNKQYHTHILISHSTYEYIKDRAEVRPLGEEQLIGKSSSVMVYELKGWKAIPA